MGQGPLLSGGAQDTRPRQQAAEQSRLRAPPTPTAPLGAAVSCRLPRVARQPCRAAVGFGFRPSNGCSGLL